MIRPLINHKSARCPEIGRELRLAMGWWIEVLKLRIRSLVLSHSCSGLQT